MFEAVILHAGLPVGIALFVGGALLLAWTFRRGYRRGESPRR